MTNSITTFFSAWSEPDSGARAQILERCVSPNVVYADPNTPAPLSSSDDLNGYLAMFTQHMPGASADVVSLSEHSESARATVDFVKDGAAMMRGQYFADLDNAGRITRIIGFTGNGDPA